MLQLNLALDDLGGRRRRRQTRDVGTRGRLRVYLGAAPGVGKTYAMLGEGHRRARARHRRRRRLRRDPRPPAHRRACSTASRSSPGARSPTAAPRSPRWTSTRCSPAAPKVALVDELAHTNVPGSRNAKRWQDIEELLAAGIDVITTVNIQHLESLNDVVEKITGVPQRETVPDAVVRAADQIELVDMTAEALRRRMAHGNVYAPEKVDAALANYFRVGNLTALRELALLWTADQVDDALQHYREQHDITGTWETRERVVVALTGGPEGETLIRRAARIAARSSGGDLLAVHVARSDGLTGASQGALAAQRQLVESLGGTYHQVLGDDIPEALLAFARAENATQLVLGDSRRPALAAAAQPGHRPRTPSATPATSTSTSSPTPRPAGAWRCPTAAAASARAARLQGFALAVAAAAAAHAGAGARSADELNLVSDMLLFLLLTVVVALVGGLAPALIAAVAGSLLLNYYFTPPLHTLHHQRDQQHPRAARLRRWSRPWSARWSTWPPGAPGRPPGRPPSRAPWPPSPAACWAARTALAAMLERVRETFALTSVTLLERSDDGWVARRQRRARRSTGPSDADTEVPAGDRLVLALRGRPLRAEDQRLVGAFAAQAAVVLDHIRLSRAAAEAGTARRGQQGAHRAAGRGRPRPPHPARGGQGVRLQPAAASTSTWTPRTATSCCQAADNSLDRLAALVDNLLDMSRLQAGAMSIDVQPTAVDEVVARALDDLGADGRRIVVDAARRPPARPGRPRTARAGRSPTSRANALRYSPAGQPPHLTGSRLGDRVELRVIDRGPGIPPDDWDRVFLPVPAPRRHRQHHRHRARPRPLPRTHRGHGRHPRARGDPGRRPHHGRLPAGGHRDMPPPLPGAASGTRRRR